MLDHVFTDAIGAIRDALESALLERQAFEEHFHTDVLLGDLNWQTSYVLPGEDDPPRVRADIGLEWSTWSQTAYRNWYLGEDASEPPRIDIEIVFRVQRLQDLPELGEVLAVLPATQPSGSSQRLECVGATTESLYSPDLVDQDKALEVAFEGWYELDERMLADGAKLDEHFAAIGGWIASALIRLGDLDLVYTPADEGESS